MCNLNKECKPTKDPVKDFVFCAKEKKGVPRVTNAVKNLTTTGCPGGFHLNPGNVPGRGFKHRNNQKLDQCAKFCRKTKRCCSFEHSLIDRMCNLNKECKPTKGPVKDFVFCVKEKKGH